LEMFSLGNIPGVLIDDYLVLTERDVRIG
jgi:hypothetical protein